jgi:hypothetical protein
MGFFSFPSQKKITERSIPTLMMNSNHIMSEKQLNGMP